MWTYFAGESNGWIACSAESAATWFLAGCSVRLIATGELRLIQLPLYAAGFHCGGKQSKQTDSP